MTYKKIVIDILQQQSREWVEKLLNENGIEYDFTWSDILELENDKEQDMIYWTVEVTVGMNGLRKVLQVGGTADDLTGICKSVIWDSKKNIVWMSVKETRDQLGITEFNI